MNDTSPSSILWGNAPRTEDEVMMTQVNNSSYSNSKPKEAIPRSAETLGNGESLITKSANYVNQTPLDNFVLNNPAVALQGGLAGHRRTMSAQSKPSVTIRDNFPAYAGNPSGYENEGVNVVQSASRMSSAEDEDDARQSCCERFGCWVCAKDDRDDESDDGIIKVKVTLAEEFLKAFIQHKVPLDPDGRFRTRWDLIIVIAVAYTVIYVPVSIAWNTAYMPWIVFDISVNVAFIVDLFINFHTSFVNADGDLEPSLKVCARHYVTTWFPIDLVASFPYDIVFLAVGADNLPTQALKALKLFRLLRITILFRFIKQRGVSFAGSLFFMLCSFILLAHWFGCLFWFLAVQEGLSNSWVHSQQSIADLADMPQDVQYSTSIYWAIVTTATLGYGDITAITYAEQIYSTVVVLLGALAYALVIAGVQQIVTWKFSSGAEYNRWMDSVVRFSDVNHLPPVLRKKLMGYYRYVWERRKTFDNVTVMDDLPFDLKADVADFVHSKLFLSNPVFCVSGLALRHMLACRMGPGKVKLPDDVLFFEGENVLDLVLVRRGALELVAGLDTPDELIVSSRRDGQYCGDLGMFDKPAVHFVSVVVSDYSEIHQISIADFLSVLENFPKEKMFFDRVAEARKVAIEVLLQKFRDYAEDDWRGSVRVRDMGGMFSQRKLFSSRNVFSQRNLTSNPLGTKLSTGETELWKCWEDAVSPDTDDELCNKIVKLPLPSSIVEENPGLNGFQTMNDEDSLRDSSALYGEQSPPKDKQVPEMNILGARLVAAETLSSMAPSQTMVSPKISKRRRKFADSMLPGSTLIEGTSPTQNMYTARSSAPQSASNMEALVTALTEQVSDLERKLKMIAVARPAKPTLLKSASDPDPYT